MSIEWTRRDLFKWASVAGALPLLDSCTGSPAILPAAGTETNASPEGADEILGQRYLKRGIEALSDASCCDSLSGHGGAAVIAAYYFCRENALDERTLRTVRTKLDEFIHGAGAFEVKRSHAGPAAPAGRIAETLAESISSLRAGGHDAIFGSLALKALRDLPELAVEPVVDGVCRLLRNFAKEFPAQASTYDVEHPMRPYRDSQDVVRATSRALLREGPDMRMSRVLHWVTHADALVTLSELGYDDVARLGHRAHQQAINHPGSAPLPPAADWSHGPQWLESGYWESNQPRDGFWAAGHAFKFPYSIVRLAKRLPDPDNGLERVSSLLQRRG